MHYTKLWSPLVNKFGGQHHGYFLPSEGVNNKALALFSFDCLVNHEKYRAKSLFDLECIEAIKYAQETKCVLSYESSFLRPVIE